MRRQSKLYAHKTENGFRDIGPHKLYVKAHGDGLIVPVLVTEDATGSFWAWWDNEKEKFYYIYPARSLTAMCLPYGPEIEEQHGRGRMCRVAVEEAA